MMEKSTVNIFNDILDSDILTYLLKDSKMDLDGVRLKIAYMKNQEILQNHPYEIWQGKNGRWYTHVPDDTKPEGRRKIAKSTREKIEDEIIKGAKARQLKGVTIQGLFEEWITYKDLQSDSDSYAAKLEYDFHKYFDNESIISKSIKDLDELTVEMWLLKKIGTAQLTKRNYCDMKSVLNSILDFAVSKRIVSKNVARGIKINRKKYRIPEKKKSQDEVFLVNEQKKILEAALDDFREKPMYTAPLAIALNFYLGLRNGELVVLNEKDIQGNYIHIQREEISKFRVEDGKRVKDGFAVKDYTKSPQSDRWLYLTTEARKIIDMVLKANEDNGFYDNGYLFLYRGNRIHERGIDSRLRKYCNQIGIKQKSNHKIRKTVISTLIDNNINIEKVMEFAGHNDKMVTYQNYVFNRYDEPQTENQLEKALCS